MEHKYEAMFIVRPDLSEEEKKALFTQIKEAATKQGSSISHADIWQEKRKLSFSIKKYAEGTYYLMNFTAPSLNLKDIRHAYKLNENILRVLITVQ
jgi:small subunit ribosomal protein S6